MKFGFLDASLNTQILDLSKDLDRILGEMRKGHRYDIRRAEKVFEIKIFDKNNITKEIFDQYRILHHKAAGRITRPLITFEMMHKWILNGNAILCGASYGGDYVNFALINIYKNGAYYSSASDDPDIETSAPASHIMQWKIIDWLKQNGFQTYELGLQQFGAQIFDIPSKKDITISFFKRGFEGYTVPLFRGEKYYSLDHFKEVQAERLENYLETHKMHYIEENR
jgi:lipid II:glycine glycyltransferase (peptidoglycan interpeptide bridge formation enzyme)